MDRGEEIPRRLVVTCRNCSVLLEFAVEILDEVARLVQFLIENARDFAVALGRDHGGLARRKQRFDHALVGIKGFVRQQGIGLHLRQQRVGTFEIMGLAGGQQEGEWIAQGIDQAVDFCA
jgi:hypothetical protein